MARQLPRSETHQVDVCVIGGGMAGLCAALAAARRGATVAMMHDRPVLGGNASSECRVHICGADRHGSIPNMRETGILEEIRMDNLRRNPNHVFSVWDAILYEKARFEPNITALLLNCSCLEARMAGARIESVTGWQLTTYTRRQVKAQVFIDCSGDAVLAPLTGADYRVGREARSEFNESIAPEQADNRTMGMSCVFQARAYPAPQPFEPPSWAHRYGEDDLPYGAKGHGHKTMGYWWLELGGENDSIHDTEELRDELLKVVMGVWDHVKNRCEHRQNAANLALEWIQFLPAKRESRRYVGAHVLCQGDVESRGRFDDVVAYGGWSLDDHHPSGFRSARLHVPATIFHEAPSPYGIPYRCLYSRNVPNLMFAGRCASATHAAMSSTRVMGTGSVMGQAAGAAAAMAVRLGVEPAGVGAHMRELQQALLRDDCYLPGVPQQFSELTTRASLSASRGDPQELRDGINRPVGPKPEPSELHRWSCQPGDWASYTFQRPQPVREVTMIVDSAMDKDPQMSHWYSSRPNPKGPPGVMPRDFRVDVLLDGRWQLLTQVKNNHQRLVRAGVGQTVGGVRWTLESIWDAPQSNLYAFYVD